METDTRAKGRGIEPKKFWVIAEILTGNITTFSAIWAEIFETWKLKNTTGKITNSRLKLTVCKVY